MAAGAALAAGASPAEATLITLDLSGQPVGSRTTPVGGSLYFDVNAASAAAAFSTTNFAAADFRLANTSFLSNYLSGVIFGANNPNNGIARFASAHEYFAGNFAVSHLVGPPDLFGPNAIIRSYYGGGAFGTGYLGLKFVIGSDIHYGWANITVDPGNLITLNSLGYESIPDVPAHVQAPSSAVPDGGNSLALLAIGAGGILAFRGRQQKTPSVES